MSHRKDFDFAKVEEIVIFTDSEYSLNSLTKWYKNWENNGWLTSTGNPVNLTTIGCVSYFVFAFLTNYIWQVQNVELLKEAQELLVQINHHAATPGR